jgi:hypothetical protein
LKDSAEFFLKDYGNTPKAGELPRVLYENDHATAISKAKILEIPEK